MLGLSLLLVVPAHAAPEAVAYHVGLRVAFAPDSSAPRIASAMYIEAGSLDDPAGREGVSHLVEHLWYDSREADGPTAWDTLAGMGCTVSAETWPEFTRFLTSCPPAAQDTLLTLELRRVLRPLQGVDEGDIARARQVVAVEEAEHPRGWREELLVALYPADHPLAARLARPGLAAHLDATMVQAFADMEYRPDQAVLALAGRVDVAAARASLDRALGTPTLDPPPRTTRRIAPEHRRTLRVAPRVLQGTDTPLATIAWSLPYGEVGGFTREMLRRVASHALWAWYRYDPRAVGLSCEADALSFAAPLTCSVVAAAPADATAIAGELRRVAETLWTQAKGPAVREELEAAHSQARAQSAAWPRSLGVGESYAATLARSLLGGGSVDILADYAEAVQRVTAADILALTREYLAADRALVVAWTAASAHPAPLEAQDLPPPEHPAAETPPAGTRLVQSAASTLPSGLRVLVISEPGLPIVEAVLRVQTGAPTADDGVAAVLFQRARGHVPDDFLEDVVPFDIADQTGLRHGVYGAASDPTRVLAGLLSRVSPRVLSLDNREPWLQRARIAAAREAADPGWWGAYLPAVALHPGDAGWARRTDLDAMAPYADPKAAAALVERLAQWYRPGNAALVVVGPQAPPVLLQAAAAAFGGWQGQPKGKADPAARPPVAAPATVAIPALVLLDDPAAPLATLAWRCPVHASDETRSVLASLYSDAVFDALRVRTAWAYSAEAWLERAEAEDADLVVSAAVPAARAPAALAAIDGLVATMAGGVAPGVLAAARDRWLFRRATPPPGGLTARGFGAAGLRTAEEVAREDAPVTPGALASALSACAAGAHASVTGPGAAVGAAFEAAGRRTPVWTVAEARAATGP
jgi:zinc protease